MTIAGSKPSLVWFKAQAPGIRQDGSSMVTMALARALQDDWDLHLVCLATPATAGIDPATVCSPPFRSVNVLRPSHQGPVVRRLAVGAWFTILDRFHRQPLAWSIEGSRTVRRGLGEVLKQTEATMGVVEYWTSGELVHQFGDIPVALLLHDIAHESIDGEEMDGRVSARSRAVMRHELAACRAADRVVVLSKEDGQRFEALGLDNVSVLPVPLSARGKLNNPTRPGAQVVFLGGLDWWPNRRGLEWFLKQVWPKVRGSCPDVELMVIGEGTPLPEVAGVEYSGFVSDLPSVLSNAQVGVVPTHQGTGVKTKTLEMLAVGLPIVSTRNGVRGTSAADAGAILADEPGAFADAIVSLLQNPSLRAQLQAEGQRELERQHSAAQVGKRLLP